MELKGKKINFLGDSITEGVGTSAPEHIYLNVLAEKAQLAEARNYGISGTRIARQTRPFMEYRELDQLDFCRRYTEMDDDADVVVVFGGTNDFGHGDAPLGAFEDRTPATFYGACHYLFSGLRTKYPTAEIVIMTPLHRTEEDVTTLEYAKGETLATVRHAMLEVAEYYALPIVDLWATSGIQPRLESSRVTHCPDGLHPNDRGHEIIASRLLGVLRAL